MPSASFAMLRRRACAPEKSNLGGVILNNIINPFFSELVASLEATICEAGGLTLLATAQNDLVRQEKLLASMVAGRRQA